MKTVFKLLTITKIMPSIFTKIIAREIPSNIVHETDSIIVIHDIAPKAKTHLLIIPKKEIPTVDDFQKEDAHLISEMIFTAQEVAKKLGLTQAYQLQLNVWEKWWQEVPHVHMHFLSQYN